jgi:hypothetical protein
MGVVGPLNLHPELSWQKTPRGGIIWYTEPEGGRKYFGALLVGLYEDKRLDLGLLADLEPDSAKNSCTISTLN